MRGTTVRPPGAAEESVRPDRPLEPVKPVRLIGGPPALLQYMLLRGWRRVCKLMRNRGFLRGAWTLGRIFDRNNALVADVGGGARLEIPLWDGYWMWAALGEPYEPEIDAVLGRALSPEVAFIDGGANIGYWSARVAASSRVTVAVEASPLTHARLSRTAEMNRNSFVVRHGALWNTDDAAIRVVMHPLRHAAASAVDLEGEAGTPGYGTFDVPTVSLSTLYDTHVGTGPVVVKLDIEGAERVVLESSRELFEQAPMLCIYEDHGRDSESRVTAALQNEGIRTWLLTARGTKRITTPGQLKEHKVDRTWGYNLAAAHPETRFSALMDEMGVTMRPRRRPVIPRRVPAQAGRGAAVGSVGAGPPGSA
jgi:FkbM family methyltransferase